MTASSAITSLVSTEHQVPKDYQGSWPLISHQGKGTLDIVKSFGREREKCHAQRWSCRLDLFQLERVRRVGRIQQDSDTRGRGDHLLEEFKPFGHHAEVEVR